MKNSSINCIQRQLQNNFKTVISFGKRIEIPLTTKQVGRLQNQLRLARILEPKQLWISKMYEPIINQLTGEIIAFVPKIVQGTYNYSLHGELN